MSVEAPENPSLIDHPMFAKPGHQPERMDVIAAQAMLKDRIDAGHRAMGLHPKQLEADRSAHEASEVEARKQWNEFGAEVLKTTVEAPKEVEDDALL
jgi:hypothetical protein